MAFQKRMKLKKVLILIKKMKKKYKKLKEKVD